MSSMMCGMLLGAGVSTSKTYVDDVFSTYLYKGNCADGASTTNTITNGVDLAGEGGLVWCKHRNTLLGSAEHVLVDTVRGVNKYLHSDTDAAEATANSVSAFNSNGFTLTGQGPGGATNYGQGGSANYTSWTFRKAKKFFDIQTWTGNNTGGRTISHNLGSVPGMILIKSLNQEHWAVYHRSVGAEDWLSLSSTMAASDSVYIFNDTEPTSSVFSVGSNAYTNGNGVNYVAYLFAHDAGGFGEEGDQSISKCGSYVGSSSSVIDINLGWEPQYVLIKNTSESANWYVGDSLRGTVTGGQDARIYPNTNDAEVTNEDHIDFTPTGFKAKNNDGSTNNGSNTFVYVAIRRPDGYCGKPPELGTSVFAMNAPTGSASTPEFISNFPVDYGIYRKPATTQNWYNSARLIAPNELKTDTNDAESAWANGISFDYNNGWGTSGQYTPIGSYQSWMWKRHAGFDVVIYKGNGVDGRWLNHSMNAVPEMIWLKRKSTTGQWVVGHKGLDGGTAPWTHYLTLETTDPEYDYPLFHDTAPTSTQFKVGGHQEVNGNNNEFLALLFSSVDGISSVGSWTGSSSNQNITLGFTARFLLIKRVNSTGDWLTFDSVRGMGGSPDYGEASFTTAGTHSWTCPSGVTSVSVVAVGAGAGAANSAWGGGGGGGGLAYKNSISVTPGTSYTVVVGAGGAKGSNGGDSTFTHSGGTLTANGGSTGSGNTGGSGGGRSGSDGGGTGGSGGTSSGSNGTSGGGGGAGGYAGNGGNGGNSQNGGGGTAGSGGGGGGGKGQDFGGGGVGLFGQGDSGIGGTGSGDARNGQGGSGGDDAEWENAGNYGGGAGQSAAGGSGAKGAIRIVWTTGSGSRSFPSTNVGSTSDPYLKLNTNAAQTDADIIGLSSTQLLLTGGDSLTNVNTAKYIYYAHS